MYQLLCELIWAKFLSAFMFLFFVFASFSGHYHHFRNLPQPFRSSSTNTLSFLVNMRELFLVLSGTIFGIVHSETLVIFDRLDKRGLITRIEWLENH